MSTQVIGAWLIAAFAVFLVGAAFWLVREFEQPLPIRLRAVHARRRRWIWIHAWMCAGTLVSILATTALATELRARGATWIATTALVAFVVGCVAFLGALTIGVTLTPVAAATTALTGVIPDWYLARHRIASGLHAVFMMLSYSAFILLGTAMLRGTLVPAWVAWVGIAAGAAGVVGYPLLRGGPFAPPIIAHTVGLMVGIVLVIQNRADSSPDVRAIMASRARSNAAIARHDTAGIAHEMMPDVIVVSSTSAMGNGVSANVSRMAAQFARRPDTKWVRTPDTIAVFDAWGVASERGHWIGTWTEPDGPLAIRGSYEAQWRRQGDTWRIQAEVFVPLRCEGGAYCRARPQ